MPHDENSFGQVRTTASSAINPMKDSLLSITKCSTYIRTEIDKIALQLALIEDWAADITHAARAARLDLEGRNE